MQYVSECYPPARNGRRRTRSPYALKRSMCRTTLRFATLSRVHENITRWGITTTPSRFFTKYYHRKWQKRHRLANLLGAAKGADKLCFRWEGGDVSSLFP